MTQFQNLTAAALVALITLAGCGQREGTDQPASGADRKPVTIKGSDTMVIMTQRLAEEYMKKQPAVLQVNGGGTGTGIAALINGTVDIAQASRPMKDAERADVEAKRNASVVETAAAIDALAVYVHPTNAVRDLTLAEIKAIYTGAITNWKDVGGSDARIILYGRESSSGTYDYFKEHVLAKADFDPRVQTLPGTAAIINAIEKDPNGIGYGGIAYGTDVRPVGVKAGDGAAVSPSEDTVADGTYPLARKLYFYSLSNAPERVTRFLEWVVSPEAQSLVASVGYFPLITTAAPEASAAATETATEAVSTSTSTDGQQ